MWLWQNNWHSLQKQYNNASVSWVLVDLLGGNNWEAQLHKKWIVFNRTWTYSWGRVGFRKGSLSAPLIALVLRCFGSEFAVRAWELLEDGGFLLASSFLCLSMSSLCWFIHSCCLRKKSRKPWEKRVATSWDGKWTALFFFYYLSQQKHQEQ